MTPLPGLRELMRAGVRRSVAAEYGAAVHTCAHACGKTAHSRRAAPSGSMREA
jgi:hypothetical protein